MCESIDEVQEVFSMLGNLCIPIINQEIKKEWIKYLEDVERVLEGKDLSYLIKTLNQFNIDTIENKHKELTMNLIEFTYSFYQTWIDYLYVEAKEEFLLDYRIDQYFIESTSKELSKCLLNENVFKPYKSCECIKQFKNNCLNYVIIEKYQDNVIIGHKKELYDILSRIRHVFKVIEHYYEKLDADPHLFVFINEYKKYCLQIIKKMDELEVNILTYHDDYILACVNVFGERIKDVYKKLTECGKSIDKTQLKCHLLQFLQTVI